MNNPTETNPCPTIPETGGGEPPTPTTPESPATTPEAPRMEEPADAPPVPSLDSCGPPPTGEGTACPPQSGRPDNWPPPMTYPKEYRGFVCNPIPTLGSRLGQKLQIPTDFDLHSPEPSRMVVADDPTTTGEPEMQATAIKPLTDEQLYLLAIAPGCSVLIIKAGAGCGKTFSQVELAKILLGIGQYSAFNTALVAESAVKFRGTRCASNTFHSLAFRAEGRRFAHRLNQGRVRSSEVARMLGLGDVTVPCVDGSGKDKKITAANLAQQVMGAVKYFCQSADREVTVKHFPRMAGVDQPNTHEVEDRIHEDLLPVARSAWEDLNNPDGKLPYNHGCYLKTWQLGNPVISADYFLLDEAQDVSPVMLDIIAKQIKRGVKVILVGDDNQEIYAFTGAKNAMKAFPDAPRCHLSQSFRFGPAVAEVANAVLSHLGEPTDLVMKGLPSIPSMVKEVARPAAILTRTNAAAVSHFLKAVADGRKPFLVGGTKDLTSFLRAAIDLQKGKATDHPELGFASWVEVEEYVKTDEGEDLKLWVKLIADFTTEAILDALERMPQERYADLVISTAHKSKGREWASVKLAADFPDLQKCSGDDPALRLLYVACTRAKLHLDVSECPPFCGGLDRDGNELPRIDISKARAIKHADQPAADETVVDLPTPVAAPAAPASNGKPQASKDAPTECTWAKWDDRWCVRGAKGLSGTVEVVRKNGTKSKARIGRAVWENGVAAIYEVA